MKKIVLIGAGSSNFGLGTISDIFKSKVLEGAIITLHDINEKSLNNTKEIANKFKQKLGVNFKIEATTNRKEALKMLIVV
jgi:alpha-galactosidase